MARWWIGPNTFSRKEIFTFRSDLRIRRTCRSLQTAHMIVEPNLGDWRSGDFKQLAVYARNESDWES
jgi:hypothetical protein